MPLPSDYPEFLASDHLSGRTRDILVTRLEDDRLQAPRVLSPKAFAVLEAILPVLLPQEDILGNSPLNLAVRIDTALAGPRDGWRFAELPPDVTAWEQALLTLDDLAQAQHSMPFPALNASEIGQTLDELAEGRHGINAANRLTPEQMQKWSFDLRADAIECFLADARVQDALGISANLNGGDGVFQGFQTVDANEREILRTFTQIPFSQTERQDLSMKTYAETEILDVIVIGSGAGGAPLAARLAQAGKSVLVLEAGPSFSPSRYTSDEIEAREIYWLHERLSGGRNPQPFGGNNSGTGVGGSLLHYGAFLPRPHAGDFRLHTETGRSVDWPFSYEELLPYIEEVEAFIGVSGPSNYPWDPTRRYAYAPPPANPAAMKMREACDAVGIRHADGPTALITRDFNQPHFGTRKACANCGACHQGCRNGAKSGADNTWLPLAVAHGAEIRSGCHVHTIETNQAGRVTGVVYTRNGENVRQRCERLVLSAGAVETARLLLHNELANSSGQVGENYMTHISTQIWGEIDEEVRPNRGYPSLTITEDMMRPKDADFAGGYLIQSLGMMPITWASNIARGSKRRGADLVRTLAGYNRSIGMGIHGDCMPSPENRVVLSDEKDALGLPKPLITHSYGPNELAMHAHASRLLTRMWEAIGAKDLRLLDRAAHMMGTARMGTESGSAVVTPYGQSFDIDNLWISDHSTFPSATAANPALTIMALSLRTADAMLKN